MTVVRIRDWNSALSHMERANLVFWSLFGGGGFFCVTVTCSGVPSISVVGESQLILRWASAVAVPWLVVGVPFIIAIFPAAVVVRRSSVVGRGSGRSAVSE